MGVSESAVALFLAAAAAACLAAALASICGPIDAPVRRSSHAHPRPRSGGMAVMFGAGAGGLALALGAVPAFGFALGPETARLGLILAAAGLGGILGMLDDLSIIGLRNKFGGLMAAAAAVALAAGPARILPGAGEAAWLLPWWLAFAGAALWAFVAANTANFMDGSDGMLAVGLGVPALGLAALGAASGAPVAAACGLLLAGGLVGFAPFNMPHARMFAGDAGSVFGGFLFAAGALDLAQHGPDGAIWIAPVLIAPFLADVFATLLVRAAKGAPLTEAHREHLYQRLLALGWPHWSVAALYGAAGAVCAALSGWALAIGPGAAMALLGAAAAFGLGGTLGLRAFVARRLLAQGL